MICWRRVDMTGLELLALREDSAGVAVESTVICGWDGGYRLDHAWSLTSDWRTRSLRIARWNAQGHRRLVLERDRDGWRVDGSPRPDLDGAAEPDLSVTPFCNTLIMRRVPDGGSLTVDTAWIDADAMIVVRSRQRYDHKGPGLYRYIDLGTAAGFEADLRVDDARLVLHYEHLSERIDVDVTAT